MKWIGHTKAWALRGTAVALALGLAPMSVNAEEPGDPSAGLVYASSHCAGCHAVRGTDNMSPNPAATPFVSVAETSGMTGRALAVWLETSHPTMPNLVVAPKDRDDVIAYIMSLQPPSAH
jgi:mono/diheme cytochrome c family protein